MPTPEQMTIPDKLDSINATKQAIRQAIVDKGVEVPEGTTFYEYAGKIGEISSGPNKDQLPYEEYAPEEYEDLTPFLNKMMSGDGDYMMIDIGGVASYVLQPAFYVGQPLELGNIFSGMLSQGNTDILAIQYGYNDNILGTSALGLINLDTRAPICGFFELGDGFKIFNSYPDVLAVKLLRKK